MSDSRLLNVIDYIESRNRILIASRGLPAQTVLIFLCFLNLVLDKVGQVARQLQRQCNRLH